MWTRSSRPRGGSQQTPRAGLADHGEALLLCTRWARALLQAGPRGGQGPSLASSHSLMGKLSKGCPFSAPRCPVEALPQGWCAPPTLGLSPPGEPQPQERRRQLGGQKQQVDVLFCAMPRSHGCLCACVDPVACRTL